MAYSCWNSGGTVPIGSISGIPIRLHILFFLVWVLAIIAQIPTTWTSAALTFLVFGPILLGTVLLHELGHCWATRVVGGEVHSILLWPLGGLAFVGHAKSPARDMFVALAGPATHIVQLGVWYLVLLFSYAGLRHTWHAPLRAPWPHEGANFWLGLCALACQLNIALLCFNLLLPAYPLDGGRIFADLLLLCRVPVRVAAVLVGIVAMVITTIIAVLGVSALVHGDALGVLALAVAIYMFFSTYQLLEAVRKQEIRQHPMFCFDDGGTAPRATAMTSSSAPSNAGGLLPPDQPRSAQV